MSELKANISNKLVDENGNEYSSITELAKYLKIWRGRISDAIKSQSYFEYDGHYYILADERAPIVITRNNNPGYDKEFEEYMQIKNNLQVSPVELDTVSTDESSKYVIALFSDAHIGKNITSDTVNGLNEYNVEIAKNRINKYFVNLTECLAKDNVQELIFASLGDGIDGFLRDEDLINSSTTPLEQIMLFQNLVYSGLKYICENPRLNLKKIHFIGIPGNHSRNTAKPMHNSSAYKMNYEFMAYKNIQAQCEITGLPIDFHIPTSELYIMQVNDKKFGFAHGSFIKGGNSLLMGIYGPVMRVALKYKKLYGLDTLFMGHMHQTVYTTDAILNSSICGYDGFALANAFQYEPPQQSYICYSARTGRQLLTRQIYVD